MIFLKSLLGARFIDKYGSRLVNANHFPLRSYISVNKVDRLIILMQIHATMISELTDAFPLERKGNPLRISVIAHSL